MKRTANFELIKYSFLYKYILGFSELHKNLFHTSFAFVPLIINRNNNA